MTGQLRREGLQTRESFVSIRFSDFERTGCQHRFRHPQFRNSVISGVIEQLYWKSMRGAHKPIRQICLGFPSLERLDTQPMLWGSTDAGRWGAIDDALQVIEQRFGENTVMTGAQFALKKQNDFFEVPPAKRARENRVVQVGVVMLALVAEEQNADRAVVGLGLA